MKITKNMKWAIRSTIYGNTESLRLQYHHYFNEEKNLGDRTLIHVYKQNSSIRSYKNYLGALVIRGDKYSRGSSIDFKYLNRIN